MDSMNLIPAVVDLTSATGEPTTGPWLTVLVFFPALVAVAIGLVPGLRKVGRQIAFWAAVVELAGFVALAVQFDWANGATTQFVEKYSWIEPLGVSWALGVKSLGLVMLLLTAVLVPLVLASAKGEDEDPERAGGYAALLMALYAFIVAIFAAYDLVVFYIAFEAMLVPLYFLIGRFGFADSETRRKAALKFLLYSLAGGLVMLGGLVAMFGLLGPMEGKLFLYENLAVALPQLTIGWQLGIFIPLFIAFAIKAPMVPVHTWLPDTAAAARPGTSVILVGVLDKIGTFGMIMLAVAFLPDAALEARMVILVLAVVSIIWGGFAANGQKNLLRLVSFTSVSHFGFIILGIFIGSEIALTGAMVFMVAHGVSIAALFLISGYLIERGDTASIMEYGGMQRVTPVIAGTWLFAGMASIALPGLSGFVPEFLVLMGTWKVSWILAAFSVTGVLLAAMYVLMPYQRMFTGPVNPEKADLPDMNARQKWVVAPLMLGMVLLGVWAAPLVGSMSTMAEEMVLNTEAIVEVEPMPEGRGLDVTNNGGNTK